MTKMTVLQPGDTFPSLTVALPGGRTLRLPDALTGRFGVVLYYRGSWCPYCNAQLSAFERSLDSLADVDISVVALSVDDEATTVDLIRARPRRPGHRQRVLQRRHRPTRPSGRRRPGRLPPRTHPSQLAAKAWQFRSPKPVFARCRQVSHHASDTGCDGPDGGVPGAAEADYCDRRSSSNESSGH